MSCYLQKNLLKLLELHIEMALVCYDLPLYLCMYVCMHACIVMRFFLSTVFVIIGEGPIENQFEGFSGNKEKCFELIRGPPTVR